MENSLFDFAAEKLERHTGLSQLEVRGTLRIALKSAGLDPKNISRQELRVVCEKVMPGELEKRGVKAGQDVCAAVLQDLETAPIAAGEPAASSPDDVFRRLAKA